MIDCACGKVHESNWDVILIEMYGTTLWGKALCEEHNCHHPCTKCTTATFDRENEKDRAYLEWLEENEG